MKKFLNAYVRTYRKGFEIMDHFTLIYGVIAFVYTMHVFDFIERYEAGLLTFPEYLLMLVITVLFVSMVGLRIFSPCEHKDVIFERNVHGDEINHLNCRSVWMCRRCGSTLYSQQLNVYQKR